MTDRVTVDITTGEGTISFPHVFESTKTKNDKGEDVYDIQIIIPKSQREDCKTLLAAIQKVGKAKWGDNWRKYRLPLRDGDKEQNDPTDDGKTKGEKYPERLGCYFINARTGKPVGVYDRSRVPITNPDDLYGGCKGKINVTFYPYSKGGNTGIGCSLNGVQKTGEGEPFGSGRPSVENMFDMLADDEDTGLDEGEFENYEEPDEVESEPAKPVAKKAAARKPAAKKAEPEPVEVEDGEDDLYGDLDDLD